MRSTRRRQRGFTLIEVLISVAIMAALLLALSAALKAVVDSYSANQASADTLIRARMTLCRISQEIRSGSEHFPNTVNKQTSYVSGTTVTDSGLSLINDEGEEVAYRYNSNTKCLEVAVDGGTSRVLASNVASFSVKLKPTRSALSVKTGGLYDELEQATISLTLIPEVDGTQLAGQTMVLSESVTPRARLWN